MPDERSAPTDEAVLVAAVAAGSEDALASLYDRHANSIFATAYRLTGDRSGAEDVVQEVFLTLWNRAERFDPAVGSLAAWLGTIARNRGKSPARRRPWDGVGLEIRRSATGRTRVAAAQRIPKRAQMGRLSRGST